MKHQPVVLNTEVIKMPKLIYNKELNMYEVWTDAVEGAQRNKEATATEEWVIQVILQQDKIQKNMNQFGNRLKIFEENIKKNNNKEIDWLFNKIKEMFSDLNVEIYKLQKKKWWHFWK